jgi:3'-5' exoribonuclease
LEEHFAIAVEELASIGEMSEIEVDEIEWVLLKHIILAHHGKLEFGSPVVPKIPEAYIISLADLASSRLSVFKSAQNDCTKEWTEKQYSLDNVEVFCNY